MAQRCGGGAMTGATEPGGTGPAGAAPPDDAAEIRVLGAIRVLLAGASADLGDAKHRLLIAMLIAAEGRLVSTEQLIDQIWDGHPPGKAREQIHSYVYDLRRRLDRGLPGAGAMLPRHRHGGYRLQVSRDRVDLSRFRDLCGRARSLRGSDDAEAVNLLRQALALWESGIPGAAVAQPLADLSGTPAAGCGWLEAYRQALLEEHHAALMARLEAQLRLGEHERIIAELAGLSAASPPDERIAGLLMIAYYRSGRLAAALDSYQRIRRRLVDELGAKPGQEISELHQRILTQDPGLGLPVRKAAPAAAGRPQLVQAGSAGVEQGPPAPIHHQLRNPGVRITILQGDLLDQDTHIAVGFSDTFDTSIVGNRLISASSIQGQLLQRTFRGDQASLDEQLTIALARIAVVSVESRIDKPYGKLRRYPLGTVAVLGPPERLIFAVAYGRMGNDLITRGSADEIWHCYTRLWEAVYLHGQRNALSVPLMGAGLARVDTLDRGNFLQLILLSFLAYSRLHTICRELRVVIHRDDMQWIDLANLRSILQAL
jgi:DNA-binding SARP family transcriptional activator